MSAQADTEEALARLERAAQRLEDAALRAAVAALGRALAADAPSERWIGASVAARALGCARSTLSRWARAAEQNGTAAVRGGSLRREDFRRRGRTLEVRLAAIRALAEHRAPLVR